MIRSFLLTATALSTLLISVSAVQAETKTRSDYVTLSGGWFDVHDDDRSAMGGLEYRGKSFWHDLLPIGGLTITEDGSYYGYAGLNYDWNVIGGVYVTPTLAVSLYEDGGGKDLGGVIEFRSGVELGYRFANDHRVGVAYQHLSNAGIYDKNPGAENFLVTYSVPLGAIFK